MDQINFSDIENTTKLEKLSKEDLIKSQIVLEREIVRLVRENSELRNLQLTDEQLKLITEEQLAAFRQALYGASSERHKKPENKPAKIEPPAPRVKKPSERYPNIPVREVPITIDPAPGCDVCGKQMSDSGMRESSEQLTVIPKKHEIIRYLRAIYRCSCQSCMVTAPPLPRIIEGSTYSNEMILDVALSKYCDLIPMERYAGMAARGGLMDLPPHSLIDLTHKFADFVKDVYRLIEAGVLEARVVNADETPHKMLEGSDKKSWYLWGFSTPTLCFLECHDTRSGDVASDFLLKSICEVLVTDVYSGYGKAIKAVNFSRQLKAIIPIESAYCNAHARRYFFKQRVNYPEANFYLDHYHEIYLLNSAAKGKPPDEVLELRSQMKSHLESMNQPMYMTQVSQYRVRI